MKKNHVIRKAYKIQRLNPRVGERFVNSNSLVEKVWQHCPFGGTKMLILLYLAKTHNENDDSSYPSQTRIAQYCRISRQQANKLLGELYKSGDVDIITYGGTATANGSTNRYRLTKYINLTFDSSISPSVLEKDLRPNTGWRVSGQLSENTVNSSGQPLVNSSGQRTKDLEPKTIKTLSPEKNLRTNTRSKPQQPTLSNQVVSSLETDLNDKGAGDTLWLNDICVQYWRSSLSSGQIKLLSKPVKASIGIYSGYYWSPIELSNHPTLGKLFRQWITEKKNPSDPTIKTVGKKRWVEQHLCNYTSPEGFLRWMQDVHGRTIEPKEPITVMARPKPSTPKKLSTIEEMEMLCYDRPMPIDSFLISSEFRKFYEANIGNVKNDEEFKRLWMNK